MVSSKQGGSGIRRFTLRASLLASTLAGVFAGTPALAQDAAPPQTASTDTVNSDIVITGSRLQRRDLVANSPITTVGAETLQAQGAVTLEQSLNQFPQLVPDTTSSTNQSGGSGILSVDLRSLGAVRTLVLVDGRRFMPGDVTGLTDLALIPDLMIERAEIITGGASAVYGSDAVAGAVNFVLKRNFEGVAAQYQYGEADRGDGASHKADLLLGANVSEGRGNITGYFSYTTRNSVLMGDRAFSANPVLADAQGRFQPFGSGNIPGGLIGINSTQIPQLTGVPDLNNASGACPVANVGIRFGAQGEPLPFCRPRDQFNYAAPNFLLRPLERYQAALNARYEIAPNVELYSQFFYGKKVNSFQQAAEAVNPSSSGQQAGTVLIPNADTNPLFTPVQRAFFAANRGFFDPDGDGVFTLRNVGRRFEEFGPRTVEFTTDAFMISTGLRGSLDLFGNSWRWDTFYQYARTDERQVRFNLLSRSRTTAGLDVVVVNGQPACRNREIPGCIPVNIFGTQTLTPAQANFLSVNTSTDSRFTREVAGGTLAGDLFDLPAGAVATAFGVEYRRDGFSITPDEVALSNDLAAINVAPIVNSGAFTVKEVFGEIRIPVLKDLPLIQSLALEGAVRFSDYSTIGSVVTWKGAVDWEITDWARFRGNYSRAIRAPNLNELFAPVSQGFIGGRDPCVRTSNPTAAQKQVCLAQGVPAQFIDTLEVAQSQGFDVQSGGNINLREETADTLTLGLVFTPMRGLSVTLDYFDITVKNAISQVDAQTLVNNCFTTLDTQGQSCQAITRNSSGNILSVRAPLLNIAERQVRGLDVGVNYTSATPWLNFWAEDSRLTVQFVGSFQFKDSNIPLPGVASVECAGFYGGPCSSDAVRITPDFRAFAGLTYTSGPVTINNQLRYIDDLELSPLSPPTQSGTLGAETYWDLSVRAKVYKNIELFGGINNVLDNQPPVMGFAAGGDSNTNPQLYDVIGRQYFIGASLKF
ncbi:TonB-dependent receptor domain-containing protein [Sphingomonas changnyeongensis]|uniref:TonB-dependent receptor domain-containing protein n=1 Tax=Sphingomonas changnyeongensis TaxID=2698679 RepID=UPI001E2D2346|nr:TonB-dependent receptor [Sphingomonas changnyeongensis]